MVVGSVIGGTQATCSNTRSFKTPVGVLEGVSITRQACPLVHTCTAAVQLSLIKQGRQSRPLARPSPTSNGKHVLLRMPPEIPSAKLTLQTYRQRP